MNKNRVNIIILLASVALTGLIAVQIYWINNAVDISKKRFEQNVNLALNHLVNRLEKKQEAAKITQKFNFRKQGIRWFAPKDSTKNNSKFK